jgi:hypothetical protein
MWLKLSPNSITSVAATTLPHIFITHKDKAHHVHREAMQIVLLFLCCLNLVIGCRSFVQPTSVRKVAHVGFRGEGVVLLRQATCTTIRLSNNRDDDKVNVNLIDDVDSFTLTAVGFGLIAFNFFVLANVSGFVSLFLNRLSHVSHP